jgi:ABC-type transporter Mla subunit MlaD
VNILQVIFWIALIYLGVKLVSKIDDLNAAFTALNDSFTAELAAIAAALTAANGSNDPAIQAVIDRVNDLKTRMDAETASLTPTP